jgi:hypothetical protein
MRGPGTTAFSRIDALYGQYERLAYGLPFEILEVVEALSTYNADFSQAVDNVRTLANSGHELYVEGPTDLATRRSKSYLEDLAKSVQVTHGGMDGVIDKLLDQATTYGAMCGEWLLDEDSLEVVDFADINPKDIRFLWNETRKLYHPYQRVSAAQAAEARDKGREVINGCVKLETSTFHYFAFDAAPGSPYGTPPFIAALEALGIQHDMVLNMSQIVKKIGLLGLVDVVVQQLPQKTGESDADYSARAGEFLNAYVDATEDMVRDGGMVHFDDVEIKSTNIGGNAAGATNIFKQNEEQVFSGLKSMPSVQGRSYSTTETYAGVAYDIIIRNTARYQRACKRMIESGYWLAVATAGLRTDKISLKFNPNKTLYRLQNAQAEALEIKNGALLWKARVINQDGFAQRLGYSSVDEALEEVPIELVTGSAGDVNTEGNDEQGSDAMDDTGGGKPDNRNNNSAELPDDEELVP